MEINVSEEIRNQMILAAERCENAYAKFEEYYGSRMGVPVNKKKPLELVGTREIYIYSVVLARNMFWLSTYRGDTSAFIDCFIILLISSRCSRVHKRRELGCVLLHRAQSG